MKPLDLTQRDKELLHWAVEGFSNRDMSLLMWLDPKTIKNCFSKMYLRYGARNLTEMISLAYSCGEVW